MILLIILVIVLFVILGSLKQINEYERGVKFTAGKFTKIMLPGWRIVLPIFQSYKKVDIRTKVDDVPEQEAITKDNVSVKINAVIYYKVFDASKAVLEVENFYFAVGQLAQTTMRNAVGSVSLDELLSERDKISSEICKIVDEATDPWGIKVNRVELKNILPPKDIQEAMEKQMRAERQKREAILTAEGEKQAAILTAEGKKEAAILNAEATRIQAVKEAEGQAEAILKIAEATAEGIKRINEANPSAEYLALEGFKSLEKVADGQSTKIVVPTDIANVTGLLASLKDTIANDKKK